MPRGSIRTPRQRCALTGLPKRPRKQKQRRTLKQTRLTGAQPNIRTLPWGDAYSSKAADNTRCYFQNTYGILAHSGGAEGQVLGTFLRDAPKSITLVSLS